MPALDRRMTVSFLSGLLKLDEKQRTTFAFSCSRRNDGGQTSTTANNNGSKGDTDLILVLCGTYVLYQIQCDMIAKFQN